MCLPTCAPRKQANTFQGFSARKQANTPRGASGQTHRQREGGQIGGTDIFQLFDLFYLVSSKISFIYFDTLQFSELLSKPATLVLVFSRRGYSHFLLSFFTQRRLGGKQIKMSAVYQQQSAILYRPQSLTVVAELVQQIQRRLNKNLIKRMFPLFFCFARPSKK